MACLVKKILLPETVIFLPAGYHDNPTMWKLAQITVDVNWLNECLHLEWFWIVPSHLVGQ